MSRMKRSCKQIFTRGINWFLALLTITLVLTACTPVEGDEYVVDDLGRMVKIEGTPERIVSLAPSNTEILFALGLGDKVVGVTDWCDYPPEALEKEKVGGFYPPDIEKIIALEPDLILATDIHRFEIIPTLEEQGFTVFALAPQTLDDVLESIQRVGKVTGKEKEATELVNKMQSKIEKIEELTQGLEARPRVFYVTWHDPIWTVGRNTWIDDLIWIAGGNNTFSQYFESGAMVEIEWVLFCNPEVIIAGEWSYGWAINATELASTNASQEGRIYQGDDDLVQRPGPRLVEGLEWFAYFIHPEIFEEPED